MSKKKCLPLNIDGSHLFKTNQSASSDSSVFCVRSYGKKYLDHENTAAGQTGFLHTVCMLSSFGLMSIGNWSLAVADASEVVRCLLAVF